MPEKFITTIPVLDIGFVVVCFTQDSKLVSWELLDRESKVYSSESDAAIVAEIWSEDEFIPYIRREEIHTYMKLPTIVL